MLVFEDPNEDRVYFGRALPREWIADSLTANGRPVAPGGRLKDAALFAANGGLKIVVVAAMN